MHPQHVAIVGCGFSGTSAFYQLVDRFPARQITVFEATGDFGPGYPYRTQECPDYLINNTTDTMCLTPASRRVFFDWLQTKPEYADMPGDGHAPRRLYGLFLQEVFQATRLSAAAKGIEVRLVSDEVTRLQERPDGSVVIGWANGEVEADAAILTTGRCGDFSDLERSPEGSAPVYLPTHIMEDRLDAFPMDATVHVLGASLSAYDLLNRLYSESTGCRFFRDDSGRLRFEGNGNERRVVLCSRSGRLKALQSMHPAPLKRERLTMEALRALAAEDGLTLRQVWELVEAEAQNHDVSLDGDALLHPYRQCESVDAVAQQAAQFLRDSIAAVRAGGHANFLVDLFHDAQLDVWNTFAEQLLAPEEERLYRSRFETAALAYAAPCPVPTAEKLLALIEAGRVSILKGVSAVSLRKDAKTYEIKHAFGVESAEFLVDATGSTNRRVTDPDQPALIRDLTERGLLESYARDAHPMPGARVDMDTFRLPGAQNVYLANMLLWGPGFYSSSALLMASIVDRIVDAMLARVEA